MDEGFSIREYVSRMRSIDVVKCWPLDDSLSDQSLPSPIIVKKFTWWSSFLLQENGKQMATEEKSKSCKGKGKAPKKRSIVELFAVAPQVEKVDDDHYEEEEEEEEGGVSNSTREEINWGVKRKRDSKKKNKEILLRELRKKPMKNKKKNLDKGMDPSSVTNKYQESQSKLQLQHQDKATRSSSYDSENDIFDRSSIRKRKQTTQQSHAENMSLENTDLMLIEQGKHNRLLGSGIILNNVESSIENQSQCFLEAALNENIHGNPEADKHLNLFENERDKLSLCVEWSKLQKHCGLGTEAVTGKAMSSVETIGIEDLGSPDLMSPPVCFKDYMGTYDELSGSNMSNFEERANAMGQSSTESTGINHSHPFGFERFPYLAPQKLLQSLFSLPTICGEKIINGLHNDFVGLPLNSRGGLIGLNSGSNSDFNQIMKSTTTITPYERSSLLESALQSGSFISNQSEVGRWDCRTLSNDNSSNPFLVERYVEENPLFVIPSRSDITNHCNKIDLDLFRKNDPYIYAEKSIAKEARVGEKIQPTMRLMGKEFLVDKRSFHGFEEENIWKDKQIINELPCGNISIDNVMIRDGTQRSLERLEETSSHPSEFIMGPRLESRNMSSHFDYHSSLMQQNGLLTTKLHEDCNVTPKDVPLGSFSGNHAAICEFKSHVSIVNHPRARASYEVEHPNMSSNANKPHGPRSVFRFPFMHPDLEGNVGSSLRCSSSSNLFDIPGNRMPMDNYQPGLNHHSQILAETNHQLTESSFSFRPQAFHANDIFSSGSTFPRPAAPVFPTQLTQHVIVPCNPGYAPEINRYGDQMKSRNRIMSNIGIMRGCDHGKKSKRQRSQAPNVPLTTCKVPQLSVTESSTSDANLECSAQITAKTDLIKPLTDDSQVIQA